MSDNGHATVRAGETPEQVRLSRDVWQARARLLRRQYDDAENRVESRRLEIERLRRSLHHCELWLAGTSALIVVLAIALTILVSA